MPDVKRHVWVGDAPTTQADIDRMFALTGDEIDFRFTRTPQKGRTFSREALDNAGLLMKAWVASRMRRSLPGKGHSKMTISMTVTFE